MFPIAIGMAEHFMVNPLPFIFTSDDECRNQFHDSNWLHHESDGLRARQLSFHGLHAIGSSAGHLWQGVVTIVLTPIIFPF